VTRMERYRLITVVLAVLVATVSVQADLMSVASSGTQCVGRACAPATDAPRRMGSFRALGNSCDFDLGLRLIDPSVEIETERREPTPPANLVILTDRFDSVDLCLYALLGLGLCRSGQWVKESGLAFVPDWYHHGAPLQIGHSYAVGPDCLCLNLVCFVQPETTPEDLKQERRQGIIAPLLRKSVFTSIPSVSRGPPHSATVS
jgi:hypothetical protein